MLKKKLEIIFASTILIALLILGVNFYKSYSFKHNDIPQEYKKRIAQKEQEILSLIRAKYGINLNVPLIVTDQFQGRLYGLTSYENGEIKIYLNKNVMQESMDYMVESVIAHEYAHALMFKLGHIRSKNEGHSEKWQETCVNLGGVDCQQYVNQKEIILSKMPF